MKINRNTDFDHLPVVLTVPEFVSATPLPRSTVYQLLKQKKLQSMRIGKRILIPRSAVIALLTPKASGKK